MAESQLSNIQKREMAKWFLLNSPSGELQFIARDISLIINDESVYNMAAAEAFPIHNKAHMLRLEMPSGSDDVMVTSFGEISENEYLDPRTAQVATVDHLKQVCTDVRPATDGELPSQYIEEYRFALDTEVMRYVSEMYPKGAHSVYCIHGKDVEGPGMDFSLVVVISAVRQNPRSFCNGSWRSIWHIAFKDESKTLELNGNIQVDAHFFEEGNVQLDSKHEVNDSTVLQSAEDYAVSVTNIIRCHETKYISSFEASFSDLPNTTFKELRRKLPVTRTQFPWHNTTQLSLTRDIANQLGTPSTVDNHCD